VPAASTRSGGPDQPDVIEKLRHHLAKKNHAKLSQLMGLQVIQCSERDTQLSRVARRPNEFLNTWSVAGLYEEGCDPVQIGWGTHECVLPQGSVIPPEGPRHQIFVTTRGTSLRLRSYVPKEGHIVGYCIPHGEASTLPLYLTVYDDDSDMHWVNYRPSQYYVYMLPDTAIAALYELRARSLHLQPTQKVLAGTDISAGDDIVGALLLFDSNPIDTLVHGRPIETAETFAWWTGSILSNEEAGKLVNPNVNATVVQVAAGVTSGVKWILENPRCGVRWPEWTDSSFILNAAKPFLGAYISEPQPEYHPPKGLQFVDFIVDD